MIQRLERDRRRIDILDGPVGIAARCAADKLQPLFGEIVEVVGSRLKEFEVSPGGRIESLRIKSLTDGISFCATGRVVRSRPVNSVFRECLDRDGFTLKFHVDLRPDDFQTNILPVKGVRLVFQLKDFRLLTLDIDHAVSNQEGWLTRSRFDVQDGVLLRARQEVLPNTYFPHGRGVGQAALVALVRDCSDGKAAGFSLVVGVNVQDGRSIKPPKRTYQNADFVAQAMRNIADFVPVIKAKK